MAEILGGLGLFLLGGWLAGCGLGHALGQRLRRDAADRVWGARGVWLAGFGATAALGWSPTFAANAPALARRWNLTLERTVLLLGGCAAACVLIPLLAWIDGLSSLVRILALAAIGGGALLKSARPRLATLGEGLAGHGLLLLGLALLGDGLAALPDGLRIPEARGSLVGNLLAVLGGAALGIGLGPPLVVALAVQAAAADAASTHTAAALLAGAGSALAWLTARIGQRGDTDDGVVAAAHGALALAFALASGLALFWDESFPALLAGFPGGPPLALAAFLCASLAAATMLTLALARPLESLVRPRLLATRPASRMPFVLEPSRQDLPVLALESLGASVDAAIREVREVARARLQDTALSQARAELAREVVEQVSGSVAAFHGELGGVRWAGAEMASALAAGRAAAACGRLLEQLLALPPANGAGDENLRTALALAAARVGNLVECSTRSDELPLIEDLRAHREAIELELLDLVVQHGWAGLLERIAGLRAVVRETLELAEARGEELPFAPQAASLAPPEASSSPEADVSEPEAVLPARRQRIKSVVTG